MILITKITCKSTGHSNGKSVLYLIPIPAPQINHYVLN